MIRVLIQAEAASREKTRYDEKSLIPKGTGRVSRPYPYAYGFVVDTTAADGDNADCYVVSGAVLKTGSIVECEPVGLLQQIENGELDHKVLAVLIGEDEDVPDEAFDRLRSFICTVFAELPGETVEVGPIQPVDAALRYLRECQVN